MEQIRFSCTKCGHSLRVGPDRAGRRVKCPKCGEALTVPAAGLTPAPVPAAAEPAPKKDIFGDDEGEVSYKLAADEAQEDQNKKAIAQMYEEGVGEVDEEKKAEEDEQLRLRRKQRKERMAALRKAPTNPEQWHKVRAGILMIAIGAWVWLATFFLHKLVLFLGLLAPSEYGYMAAVELPDTPRLAALAERGEPWPAGDPPPLRVYRMMMGLLGSSATMGFTVWTFRVLYLLTLIKLIIDGVGFGLCANVPPRFGTRGLAIAGLAVVGVTFLLVLLLMLLPSLGVIPYTMVQLLTPEVAMMTGNIERAEPIHVTFSAAPFWESLFAVILRLFLYVEPLIFYLFLRACGRSVKDETMDETAHGLIRLGLGLAFIDMSYLLISHAGTSEVLINILRAVYLLGVGFTLWQIIWTLRFCFFCRKRIVKALHLDE